MTRDIKLTIRLSEDENDQIIRESKKVNMQRSEFVRERALWHNEMKGSLAKTGAAAHIIHIQNLINSISCVMNGNEKVLQQIRKEVDTLWLCLE